MFCSKLHLFLWILVFASVANSVNLFGRKNKIDSKDADLYVETLSGPVKGVRMKTKFNQKLLITFKGIPYAAKPIKDKRFKAPTYIKKWKKLKETKEFKSACISQPTFGARGMDEDCLYLNIFRPAKIPKDKQLCTIIYIYGGTFTQGRPNPYNPELMLDEEDFIFVSFSFRSGIFGFMNLGTKEYSGNMGLKDQQMAMKWVHTNIERFGGSQSCITLFGFSSGSSAVHYHICNEVSRQYFTRAILSSGTMHSTFALSIEKDHRKRLFEFGNEIQPKIKNNLSALIKFLVKYPNAKELANKTRASLGGALETIWSPNIEPSNAKSPFITRNAEKCYLDDREGIDVDVLFGLTNGEYELFFNPAHKEWLKTLSTYGNLKLPLRGYNVSLDMPYYRNIGKKLFDRYLPKPVTKANRLAYLNMLSDLYIVYHIEKSIELHANLPNAKTYLYRFSVNLDLNKYRSFESIPTPVATHGDEICFMFMCARFDEVYERTFRRELNSRTERAMNNLMRLYLSFAMHGKPTVEGRELEPVSFNQTNFVDITNNGLVYGIMPIEPNIMFFENLLDDAYAIASIFE